jgi:hypothetical protein
MALLIEDSARNTLAGWTEAAVKAGAAQGVVLSPFSSPRYKMATGYKPATRETVTRLQKAGAEVWFSPETHALQMPSVGDFRFYDDWPLWSGTRGQLQTESDMRGHVRDVFALQDALGVPHLAPTLLLHSPQSTTSKLALQLAEVAVAEDPACHLTIAGDAAFWAGGTALDAHIGGLSQLEPAGWWLTVVRNLAVLPVQAIPEEVHGVCRTARALSEDGPVHISHGDLAGLPAVAAGATSLGVGWDVRQRVCAYASYEVRGQSDGGQWFQQRTFKGLLSLLSKADAEVLATRDATMTSRLLPGSLPPNATEGFRHHAAVMSAIVNDLTARPPADAYEILMDMYEEARKDWNAVALALSSPSKVDQWVTPLRDGLARYGRTEGF